MEDRVLEDTCSEGLYSEYALELLPGPAPRAWAHGSGVRVVAALGLHEPTVLYGVLLQKLRH